LKGRVRALMQLLVVLWLIPWCCRWEGEGSGRSEEEENSCDMAQIKTTSGHRLSSMDGPRTPTIPTTEFWDKIHELCDELERAGTSPIPSTIHLLRTSTPAFETSSSAQVEACELSYGLEDRTREELPPLDRFDLSTNQPHWNDPSSPPCFRVGWIEPSDDEIARVSDDILWNPTTPCSDADSPPPSPSSPSPSSSSTSEVSQPDESDAFDRWQRSQSCAPLPSQLSTLEETRPHQMQTSLSTPTLTVAQIEEEAWEFIGAAWRSGIPAGETAPSSEQPLESQTPSSPTLARNDDAAWEAVVRAHRAEVKAGRLVPPPQRPSSSSSYARELTRGITAQDEERSDRWYSLFCPLVEDPLDLYSPQPESPPSFVSAALQEHPEVGTQHPDVSPQLDGTIPLGVAVQLRGSGRAYWRESSSNGDGDEVDQVSDGELSPFEWSDNQHFYFAVKHLIEYPDTARPRYSRYVDDERDRHSRTDNQGEREYREPFRVDRRARQQPAYAENHPHERRSIRLPPEVLARVFHYIRFPGDGRSYERFNLLDAALVCREWSIEAHRALYEATVINRVDRAKRFEWCRYHLWTPVQFLVVDSKDRSRSDKWHRDMTVANTVQYCTGVKTLIVAGYGGIQGELFDLEALSRHSRFHPSSVQD
jgi:hypothetical protein